MIEVTTKTTVTVTMPEDEARLLVDCINDLYRSSTRLVRELSQHAAEFSDLIIEKLPDDDDAW